MSDSLSAQQMLFAYAQGVFPMAEEEGEVFWFRPDPRGILPLDSLHVPRSVAKVMRQERFSVRWNTNFAGVLAGCAAREDTWLQPCLREVFLELFESGFAYSVECWDDEGLAGGVYGLALGGAFFGESMFTLRRDASKVALVSLVQRLRECGFTLFDVQWSTPHLARFGVVEIAASEFIERLQEALSIRPNQLLPVKKTLPS